MRKETSSSVKNHGEYPGKYIRQLLAGVHDGRPLCAYLVFLSEVIQFGQAEDRSVLADVFVTYVAAPAFSDAAFHTHLQRGNDILF